MSDYLYFEQSFFIKTDRLLISSWRDQVKNYVSNELFLKRVTEILTPEVIQYLPEEWGGIKTLDKAQLWVKKRAEESCFYTIKLLSTDEVIGFVFLYLDKVEKHYFDLNFGYLLSKPSWRMGFGNELVNGIVHWSEMNGKVKSISGGVDKENIGSIKVLKKNGFNAILSESKQENTIFFQRKFI